MVKIRKVSKKQEALNNEMNKIKREVFLQMLYMRKSGR